MAAFGAHRSQYKFHPQTFVIGLVLLSLMIYAHSKLRSYFEYAELSVDDWRLYSRKMPAAGNEVVIAAIDDKSIAELGHWPWPRGTLAQLQRALIDYRAAVAGYDVMFSEADRTDVERAAIADRLKRSGVGDAVIAATLGQNGDQAFADAIKAQGATILGYTLGSLTANGRSFGFVESGFTSEMQQPAPMAFNLVRRFPPGANPPMLGSDVYRPPTQVLNAAAHGTGYVSIDGDQDGKIRSIIMAAKFKNRYCVPLSLAILRTMANDANLALTLGASRVEKVELSTLNIPVNEVGQMLVHFRGGEGTFKHFSISDLIAHRIPPAALANKIVLVGVTARGLGDRFVTPMGADFPGVEIHANAIDNVIKGDFVRHSERTDVEYIGAVVVGFLMVLAASFVPASMAITTAIMLAGAYFSYAERLLFHDGVLIGVVYPLLTVGYEYTLLASYRYFTEGIEKRRLRHAFEHYLDPDVVASVMDKPESLKLGGEKRHLSILFADIVGFTSRSEKSEPEALVALLNTYMTNMTRVIMESKGLVDKLMGDGIMAFWGAPNALDNPARHAIDCGLEMLATLRHLRETDARFADMDIGIGIATGDVTVGNFGGERRFDYSAIGDTVNFASRVEGLTRKFKVHLLVSRQTLSEAGGAYIAREIGLVKVKGKENLEAIVEVVAPAGNGVDPGFYNRFARVSDLLRSGEAGAARDELLKLHDQNPGDHVIELYLEKLADPHESPREIVFEFESK